MGKFYNDGHPIEIPDYKENNSRKMKSTPPPTRYDDAQKESDLMRQPPNEKIFQKIQLQMMWQKWFWQEELT